MDLYDWLLAIHVLGAFVLVASLVVLWALVFATRPAAPLLGGNAPKLLGDVGGPLVGVGMGVTIIFGIWLALNVDRYELWDGWIIGAIVLWVFAGWAGGEAGRRFREDPVGSRDAAIRFQVLNSVAVLLILILMVWKPGA
jgi:uncharacterized membrane protein